MLVQEDTESVGVREEDTEERVTGGRLIGSGPLLKGSTQRQRRILQILISSNKLCQKSFYSSSY